ncbi:MAG: acetate/propionate family kinase [Archangium sp.]|nr:acetate/propionate family kinase [Archangium sp.]MDP3152313.1 acetate/propionate family kinase [Archangium sp.]MDP3570710.1 acetate/propionate family kinase [Archangium sp.]
MNVLVINSGSSSVKYQVIDTASSTVLHKGLVERIGQGTTHVDALAQVIAATKEFSIAAVGHRVVHGGEKFVDAARIDDEVEKQIEACVPLAPLHNPANLTGIRVLRAALPGVPQVAVFDTAFHARMPRRARTYAIDQDVAQRHGIRRYGFHGTSHAWVAHLAAKHLKRPLNELRLITLHLGNGASACAVELGHSTETSMGLTPLEGLVMGTRSGDLDAGVVLALLRSGEFDVKGVDTLLNSKSGLTGLSGVGNDLRDIEQRASDGDDRCRLAVAVFAHRVRKYIGAYAATMGGLDAVVLTGGIGENAVAMRRRILQRLDFLGLVLDEDANADAKVSREKPVGTISAELSRVAALVVKTDEELSIAKQTAALVAEHSAVKNPRPIPVAISARHLHLDAATFALLFGPEATPTRLRDISQPGQYACEEKVNVIGPRNRIDGVRLLGPLRPACQVEVSRTDEFLLGVDAPIRDSGKTLGSAPITLEGPKGTVHLKEGLICAKRHIHMTPEDAAAYGVVNGDEVEVAIAGGPRPLVFGDVLVRVSSKHKLEMHIDTDEANAAELNQGAVGALAYTDVLGASAVLQKRRVSNEE